MKRQPDRSDFRRLALRAAPLLLLAAAGLSVLELIWLAERGTALSPAAVTVAVASIATAVVAVALAVLGCLALGGRIAPRWPVAVLMLATILPAYLAVQSLFSGGFARDIPLVGYIKFAAGSAIVAGVPIAVWLFRVLVAVPRGNLRRALAVAAAAATIGLAYFDTHFQVGLYPAAHALLAVAIVYCAALAAVLALPTPAPRLIQRASLAAAGVLALTTAFTWSSAAALRAATYSDGLMPKIRTGIVGVASAAARGLRGPEAVATLAVDPAEFRFAPTHAAELDAIRANVHNVVFVLVDALRDDHVGKIRAGRSITPFIDELGPELIRFKNAYAGSDRTGQSMPVLMTSYPLPVVQRAEDLGISLESWVGILGERGFHTFANGNCDYLARKYPHVPLDRCYGAQKVGVPAAATDRIVPELLEFINAQGDAPFAVFTHWMDTHILKTVHDPHGEYAAMVTQVDARLRTLVEGIERLGHRDDTLVVVTADHGYGLGEGNRFLSNQCCAELQVRVPLLLVLPGSAHAGRAVEQNVGAVDVMPTILDVLAPDEAVPVGGRSLLGLLYDAADPRLANEHAVYTLGIGVHMVRSGNLKLHWNEYRDTRLVVDVAEDPLELDPLVFSGSGDKLWDDLQAELERHARFAASLTVGDRDIDKEVAMALLRRDVDSDALQPFFETFWQRSADTQYALLKVVMRYRIGDLTETLDALTRDTWSAIDQDLLVTRASLDSRAACTVLAERFGRLEAEPRRWAGEVYPYLGSRCRGMLTEPLLSAIRDKRALAPQLEDPEGHFLALAAASLAIALETGTPRDVKELVRDLYNEAVAYPTRYRIPSVRNAKPFDRTVLLEGLESSVTAEDIDLLSDLAIDNFSAQVLTRMILEMDTPESRDLLMHTVHSDLDRESARSIVLELRRSGRDSEVRRAAANVLGERFPVLDTGVDEED